MDLLLQLEAQNKKNLESINAFFESYLSEKNFLNHAAVLNLLNSMRYSVMNGGKRFRPMLSLQVAEAMGCNIEKVIPFACAIEMIHTYSLIHDDLPCMDNDDTRRGQPTNHKVYGDAVALLAGDALLTESFALLAKHYSENGFLLSQLVRLVSEAAGINGMIGGQAIDMAGANFNSENLFLMHKLKTGCLIRISVEGAAIIAGASAHQHQHLKSFGEKLGLAFQIADDILDFQEKGQEDKSFVTLLGIDKTKELLNTISSEALIHLHEITHTASALDHLVKFNQNRKI